MKSKVFVGLIDWLSGPTTNMTIHMDELDEKPNMRDRFRLITLLEIMALPLLSGGCVGAPELLLLFGFNAIAATCSDSSCSCGHWMLYLRKMYSPNMLESQLASIE